jgi:hypothetical protein
MTAATVELGDRPSRAVARWAPRRMTTLVFVGLWRAGLGDRRPAWVIGARWTDSCCGGRGAQPGSSARGRLAALVPLGGAPAALVLPVVVGTIVVGNRPASSGVPGDGRGDPRGVVRPRHPRQRAPQFGPL